MRSIRSGSIVCALGVAATLAVIAHAQDQQQAQSVSGIYVVTVAGQPEVRLPSNRFEVKEKNIGKSMATMGLVKPQMVGEFGGAKADSRVAGDAEFRFQFSPQSGSNSKMDMSDMMSTMNGGAGDIPSMAKTPQDFFLVKLSVANDNREAHFGSGAGRPKDTVDVSTEKTGPNAYRVRPKHPLAPGEYAFCVRMGNTPMGIAWEFGVDGK